MTRRPSRPEPMHRGGARWPRAAALVALAGALALAGCATTQAPPEPPPPERIRPSLQPDGLTPALADAAGRVQTGAGDSPDRAKLFKGTGVVVQGQPPGGGLAPVARLPQETRGNVSLNFEGADIRDVVRNILGDILGQNYVIDPAVGGQVTIRTSSGLPRSALTATLETLLRMNGATMVYDEPNEIYKIVPQGAAVRGNVTPMLGNVNRVLPPGFSVQIVPLRFVSAREMLKILEPIAKDAQAVRADDLRNLLILSGTERELIHLMDTIALFDIDWMRGMSAGIFPLQSADVKAVGQEIEKLLGQRDANPLGGLIRIVPIERMNALLVVTPNPALIEKAREWIEKLDQGTGGEGVRFYVYNLQNSRAERVGPLLQQAFTGRTTTAAAPQGPSLAPGTPAGTIVSPPPFQPQPTPPVAPPTVVVQPAAQPPQGAQPAQPGAAQGIVRNIQVVADKDNNTLLVVATPGEWVIIEAALRKLDVAARQVMIEMVIAEVSLVDDFQFGVEWYFRKGNNQAGGNFRRGTTPGDIFGAILGTAVDTAAAGIGARVPGFNYLLSGSFPGGIQAALSLLGTASNTKIVANPHVAALDNQRSTIKVGDRIPISQQTIVGGTTNAVTTTSQYIDTGVLVAVTPRINAGGLVTLDIQAEVSNPGDANPGDAPPINTRSLQSIVAVQSGETLIMGGLIRDTKTQGSEGIPLLSKIPGLGGLFGQQEIKDQRSELVLFVTPRVVETSGDMRGIVDDLRRRMERLGDVFPPRAGDPPNVPRQDGLWAPLPAMPMPAAAPAAAVPVQPPMPAPTLAPPPAAQGAAPAAAPQAGATPAAQGTVATPPVDPAPAAAAAPPAPTQSASPATAEAAPGAKADTARQGASARRQGRAKRASGTPPASPDGKSP